MRTLTVVALLVCLELHAGAAFANRAHSAAYRYSGRPGDSTRDCTSCHDTPSVTPPSIAIEGLEGLTAGGSASIQLTVTSANPNPTQRLAGFVLRTDGAGVFSNTVGDGITNDCALGNGIKHLAPESTTTPCDGVVPCPSFFGGDGTATYAFALEGLQPGSFTLYVGANDGNNNRSSSSDRGAVAQFPFTVAEAADGQPAEQVSCVGPGEGEGEGEGEDAGEGEGGDAGVTGDAGPGEVPPGCTCVSGGTEPGVPALISCVILLAGACRPRWARLRRV